MHRRPPVKVRRDFGEGADGVRFVHANRQVMRYAPFEFRLLPLAEQQQRRGDPGVAQRHRLFECAQAEAPRTFFQRDARHIKRAVAVSLILYHGEQFHVARQIAADQAQIVSQLAEVNLGPRRSLRKIFRIQIHRNSEELNHEMHKMTRKKLHKNRWN